MRGIHSNVPNIMHVATKVHDIKEVCSVNMNV